MTNQSRLKKLQSDFHEHEQESEELAVAINNEHHEERILKNFKKIDVEHPDNKFF